MNSKDIERSMLDAAATIVALQQRVEELELLLASKTVAYRDELLAAAEARERVLREALAVIEATTHPAWGEPRRIASTALSTHKEDKRWI